MCDHSLETKESVFMPVFSSPHREVYICECGALFDLRHPDNYSGDNIRTMTGTEINSMVEGLLADQKSKLVDDVISSIRAVIQNDLERSGMMTERQGEYVTEIDVNGALNATIDRLEHERDAARAQARFLSGQVFALTADFDALDALLAGVGTDGESLEERVRNLLQVREGAGALCDKTERLAAENDLLKRRIALYRDACRGDNAVLRYRRRGVLFAALTAPEAEEDE